MRTLARPVPTGRTAWSTPAAAPLFALATCLARVATPALPDRVQSVRVNASSFGNTTRALNCRLFAEREGFPGGGGVRTVRAPIERAQASCTFLELAPGTSAVAAVHDVNGNGRLDRNLLGVAGEGHGVSRHRTHLLSSPNRDERGSTSSPGTLQCFT
jgi:uncharacterized protein (DUF2141 family)